jgi:hypothetical protein
MIGPTKLQVDMIDIYRHLVMIDRQIMKMEKEKRKKEENKEEI